MAILKNLIVNGASRFLQKAYFDDIAVSGTTTINDLDVADLDVSGNAKLNGNTNFYGGIGIYNNAPKIDFHYKNNSAMTSRIFETQDTVNNKYWLNLQNNVKIPETIEAKNLVVNNTSNFGDKVTIDGDVDIIGNLRWTSLGEHMTMQNLGGTLLVAPTIYQSSVTDVTVNIISGKTVTLTVHDETNIVDNTGSSTQQNYWTACGADWRVGSKVRLSGKIDTCVLGASDGMITAINVGNHTMQIKATIENASRLTQGVQYRTDVLNEFAIMMYQVCPTGVQGETTYPVGLILTSYGDNKLSYIDVYGGRDVSPVARMGNLGKLKYKDKTTGNDALLDYQWGLYTKGNSWIEGYIVANEGLIGGWTISEKMLSYGNFADSQNGSVYLIPGGSSNDMGIGNAGKAAIGGSDATKDGWVITSRNTFGVNTDGGLYVSYGKIAGWDISSNYIKKGNLGSSRSMILSPSGYYVENANVGGSIDNTWAIAIDNSFGVDNVGRIYSTAGRIGNWIITGNKLYGYSSSASGATLGTSGIFLIPGGASSPASIAGSSSISTWAITAGSNFGVTYDGHLYAANVTVSGEINASTGEIGGFSIDADSIFSKTKTSTASGALRLSTTDFSRTINGLSITGLRVSVGSNFGIDNTGIVYANNAVIFGDITATGGSIGGWTIGTGDLHYSTYSLGHSNSAYLIPGGSSGSANIGSSGSISGWTLTLGNTFGVTSTGAMYSTSGKIGGWTIKAGELSYVVNTNDKVGATKSAFLIPGGSSAKASIGGSDSISGWVFTSGNTFGVTSAGALYSTSGKIGGMTIDSGGIYTGDPRNNNADTGIYFGSTDITRTIGIGTYEHIRLAIGNTFGVQRSGTVWMRSASADNITVTRAVRIKGYPAEGESSNMKGESFDCIRANALRVTGTGYQRTLAIGTNFQEAQVDGTYGGYTNIRPTCGITIDQYENIMYSGHKSILSINASDINLQGRYDSTPLDTSVYIKGTLQVSSRVLADSFQFDSGENRFSAVGVMNVTKNTEYTLIASHVYMLVVWYNTASGTAARGAWIFKCGQTFYMKLDTFHGVSGSAATNTATGSGVTITLTTTTMKFTASVNTSTCKLIDLG